MSKRYFKIETGRYGGELVIGTVSKDFVDYWAPVLNEDGDSELIEYITTAEWGDEVDESLPTMTEDGNVPWFEVDDLEHVNGPFEDNEFTVTEIQLHEDAEYVDGLLQWKEGVDHDYSVRMYEEVTEIGEEKRYNYESYIYGREAYSNETELTEESDEYTPILTFFSSEKGGFGEVYVETDGEDFDPELLQIGTVETDQATIIEAYWYDRRALQVDFDHADTNGKGYYASVGFMKNEWHDKQDRYVSYDMSETEAVKEAFEWFYEDRE